MNEPVHEEIIEKALKKGCDAAELYMKSSRGISVEAKGGEVESLEASRDFGIALKIIRNGKLGFSFTTNPEEIENIIDEAMTGAEHTGYDEYFTIPEYKGKEDVMMFDRKIESIREEDIINDALLLEKSTLAYDKRIRKVRKAEVGCGTGRTAIVNSRGVNITYESTFYSAHVTTLAVDNGGDNQMGWDYAGSRRMSDVDVTSVGEGAAQRALELLGSRKISAVKAPIVLSPSVAVDFLEILSSSLSAEAVQKNRSFLAGKTGRKIVSHRVEIIDDGTMAWGAGTRPVDDEGVSTGRKALISEGVLNGYMHNSYTANRDGIASTGNAVRGGFKGLPGVGITNFYLSPNNNGSGNGLIGSLSRGILVLGAMGVHTADQISGDFSVGISGLWIENGEPAYPVKEAVISGNILDLFRKVEEVGSDMKFYGNVGSPSLLIGEMDISA